VAEYHAQMIEFLLEQELFMVAGIVETGFIFDYLDTWSDDNILIASIRQDTPGGERLLYQTTSSAPCCTGCNLFMISLLR
jgi:hypothetical protein